MITKSAEVLTADLKRHFSSSRSMKSHEVDFLCVYVLLETEKRKKKAKKKKKKKTARTILGITVVTVNHFIGNNAY